MAFRMMGFEALKEKMRQILGRVERATADAALRAGYEVQREAQRLLALTSHPPGTPTPSAPGSPPSLVSGALRRSITVEPPVQHGDGWSIDVGPRIVYGRIQELGGSSNGSNYLPPRPYMAPAWATLPDKVRDIFEDAWANAVD